MRPDTFEDLPDELRPLYVRKRSMRTIGRWMALVGSLLVCSAAVGAMLLLGGLFSPVATLDHVASTSVVGGVLLLQGLIAIVVANAM